MAAVIRKAKKTQTYVRYVIRSSTRGAKLDAAGGYSGNGDCTALARSLNFRMARVRFAAPGNPNSSDDYENRQDAAKANDPKNGSAILRGRRIVMEAEQQDAIDRRADLSCRSIDETQAHVAAGILDAVEIAGDAAVGGQDHHAAGMREEFGLRVVTEAEIRGARDSGNGFFRAGQEMPA